MSVKYEKRQQTQKIKENTSYGWVGGQAGNIEDIGKYVVTGGWSSRKHGRYKKIRRTGGWANRKHRTDKKYILRVGNLKTWKIWETFQRVVWQAENLENIIKL